MAKGLGLRVTVKASWFSPPRVYGWGSGFSVKGVPLTPVRFYGGGGRKHGRRGCGGIVLGGGDLQGSGLRVQSSRCRA